MTDLERATSKRCQHFIRVLNDVRTRRSWSQRKLCEELDITIGTLTKYLRGVVDPGRVGSDKLRRLASCRGVTLDSLMRYLDTGIFSESITIDDVASWIRSEAGQQDLPLLLDALSETSRTKGVPVVDIERPIYRFTDDEAKEFSSYISSAMKALQKSHSSREIWRHCEDEMSEMPLQPEEIDVFHDLCMGTLVVDGEVFTKNVIQLSDRFPGICPLVKSLQKLDDQHEIKALTSAQEFCNSRSHLFGEAEATA